MTNNTKISIIGGGGNIGGALAYTLILKELANTIVLVDLNKNVAEGKALDLGQAAAFEEGKCDVIGTDDYSNIENSDVIVILAGFARKSESDTREILIDKNKGVMKSIAPMIAKHSPNSFVIVVTNPVDIIAWIMSNELNSLIKDFNYNKLIGLSGVLDGGRFQYFAAKAINSKNCSGDIVSPYDVQPMIIGSHNNKMMPMIRYSGVNGVSFEHIMNIEDLPADDVENIKKQTISGGGDIVKLLGTSAYFAPARAICKMIKAYTKNEKRLLCCSTRIESKDDKNGIYLGLPVIIGSEGVEKKINFKFTDEELKSFNNCSQEGIKILKESK